MCWHEKWIAQRKRVFTLSKGFQNGTLPYLQTGNPMPKAGNKDNKRPVIWLHHHSSSLGTAHVEGSWAPTMGTLHTAASVSFPPLLTEDTFLHTVAENQ